MKTVYTCGPTSGSILADHVGLSGAFGTITPQKAAQVLAQYKMDSHAARLSVVEAVNAQSPNWRAEFFDAAKRRGVEL